VKKEITAFLFFGGFWLVKNSGFQKVGVEENEFR
jgi:hypothetical protein